MVASNVLLPTVQGHHHTPVLCPRLEQCIFTLFSHGGGGQGVRSLQPETSSVEVCPRLRYKNTQVSNYRHAHTHTHPPTPPHTHTHIPPTHSHTRHPTHTHTPIRTHTGNIAILLKGVRI